MPANKAPCRLILRVGTIWRRARPLASIPAIRTCSLAGTRGSRRFPNIAPHALAICINVSKLWRNHSYRASENGVPYWLTQSGDDARRQSLRDSWNCSAPRADFFFVVGLVSGGVVGFDVVVENFDELGYDPIAFEGGEQAPVHVDGGLRFFGGSRERNSEACVLGFSGTVYYAAHHSYFHFFDARVAFFPDGHLLAQVGLDLLGHFLKEGAGGAAAAGAGRDLRGEAANAQRLENLLRYTDFFGTVTAGGGS